MIKRLLLVFIKRGKKGNKFDIKVEQRWECNCFKRKKKGGENVHGDRSESQPYIE